MMIMMMMMMMMMMMIMSKKRGRRGFECVCACILGGVRGGPGGEGECDIMEKTFHSRKHPTSYTLPSPLHVLKRKLRNIRRRFKKN